MCSKWHAHFIQFCDLNKQKKSSFSLNDNSKPWWKITWTKLIFRLYYIPSYLLENGFIYQNILKMIATLRVWCWISLKIRLCSEAFLCLKLGNGRHLENLFFAPSPEPKGQLTPNLLGSIGVTCRSKIAKIVPIGNQRWRPWQPSWKSIFCFFSWTERLIDSRLAGKHRGDF